MRECFGICLKLRSLHPPMSRRRVANRRELLLPLRMPEDHPTGIALASRLPAGPTGTIPGKAGGLPQAWPRHTSYCRPAKQTSQAIEGAVVALILDNHLLARLIFERIGPRTYAGMVGGEVGSRQG